MSRSLLVPLFCVWLSLTTSALGQRPLEIERIRLATNAEVSFEAQPGVSDTGAAADIQNEPQPVRRETSDHAYMLCFLPSKVRSQNAGSYFSYDFYVAPAASPSSYARYRVNATTVGSFLDAKRETTFRVGASEGHIELPVFDPSRPSLVEVPQSQVLNKLPTSGGSLRVSLKNRSGLGLLVRLQVEGGSGAVVTAATDGSNRQLPIPPLGTKDLILDVKPFPFQAMTSTWSPASVNLPHGSLKLTIDHDYSETPSVGPNRDVVLLPLEFDPSVGDLGRAVAIGAAVGWVLCMLVWAGTGKWRKRGVWMLLARLPLAVFVGWIAAIASTLTQSRLILFNVDLNPTRLPPALMLGFTSGVMIAGFLDLLYDRAYRWVQRRVPPPARSAV